MQAKIPDALLATLDALKNKDKFLSEWQTKVATLARDKARAKHQGHEPWGGIAQAVRRGVSGADRTVYVDGDDSYGRIGIHKQEGGDIRPRNAKTLAIPLPDKVGVHHNRSAKIFFGGGGDPVKIALGDGKALLGTVLGDGNFLALYVLTPKVTQKAEPWWPEAAEVESVGEKVINKWLQGIGHD